MSEIEEKGSEIKKANTPRKRANELDGKTWLRYSVSVWSDIRKTKEEVALKHPAMFPSALAFNELLEVIDSGIGLVGS